MTPPLRLFTHWLPPFLYIGAILALSSSSQVPFASSFPFSDKVAHFTEYALLAALSARAMRAAMPTRARWLVLALTVTAAALLGAFDEWYQHFTPGRTTDIRDWIADTTGALVGCACYLAGVWLLQRRARGRRGHHVGES